MSIICPFKLLFYYSKECYKISGDFMIAFAIGEMDWAVFNAWSFDFPSDRVSSSFDLIWKVDWFAPELCNELAACLVLEPRDYCKLLASVCTYYSLYI